MLAGLLTLATRPSNAFAISGLVLAGAAVGWALGPFKTPMVWSEGGLVTYQGNASQQGRASSPRRWRVFAVPAFGFAGGILLLIVAGALAAR